MVTGEVTQQVSLAAGELVSSPPIPEMDTASFRKMVRGGREGGKERGREGGREEGKGLCLSMLPGDTHQEPLLTLLTK